MPTTVDTLMLGTGIDLAGLTLGLQNVGRSVQNFGANLDLSSSGADIASRLIASLESAFTDRRNELAAALSSGLISPAQFTTLAQSAAADFTTGLERGLGQFASQGLVTDSIREQFVSAMGTLGTQGGTALAAAVANAQQRATSLASSSQAAAATAGAGAADANAVLADSAAVATRSLTSESAALRNTATSAKAAATALAAAAATTTDTVAATQELAVSTERTRGFVNASGDEFTHLGKKGVESVLAISIAMSALANNADTAGGKLNQALGVISGLGLLLGPDGLIVSGAATALQAINSVLSTSNDKMQKAADDLNAKIAALSQQHDLTAFTNAMQQLQPIFTQADQAVGHTGATIDEVEAKLKATHVSISDVIGAIAQGQGSMAGLFNLAAIEATQEHLQAIIAGMKEFNALGAAAANPLPTLNTGSNTPGPGIAIGGINTIAPDVQHVIDSLQSLVALAPEVNDRLKGIATPGLLPLTKQGQDLANVIDDQALAAFDKLAARLAAQHGLIDADTIAMAAALKQFEQFSVVQVLRVKVPTVEPITIPAVALVAKIEAPKVTVDLGAQFNQQDLVGLEQQLKNAQALQDAANISGDTSAQAAARQRTLDDTRQIAAFENDVLQRLKEMNAPAETIAATIATLRKAMQDAGLSADQIEKALHVASAADDIRSVGDAVGSLSDAFGDVATQAGKAIDAVATLVAQSQNLKTNFGAGASFSSIVSSATSIVGAIGTIGGLVGGLFGESAADRERNQIIQQNNAALQELTRSLTRFGETGTSLNQVSQAVAGLIARGVGEGNQRAPIAAPDARDLNAALQSFGVTFAQLQQVAKDNGIQLLDSKGLLVAGALDKLRDALGATTESLTHFAGTFADQLDLQKLINRASGTESPLTDLQSELSLFATQSKTPFGKNGVFGEFFAGIDVTTTQGQAELRSAIAKLLKAIQDGAITLSDLGNFANVQDVASAASTLLDSLDAMSSAADGVTDSLLNVPTGFKVALDRFNSTLPNAPGSPGAPNGAADPNRPILGAPGSVGITDPAVSQFFANAAQRGGISIDDPTIKKIADAIGGVGVGTGGDILIGTINVDAGDRDAVELTDDIVAQLRLRSRGGFSPLAGVALPT